MAMGMRPRACCLEMMLLGRSCYCCVPAFFIFLPFLEGAVRTYVPPVRVLRIKRLLPWNNFGYLENTTQSTSTMYAYSYHTFVTFDYMPMGHNLQLKLARVLIFILFLSIPVKMSTSYTHSQSQAANPEGVNNNDLGKLEKLKKKEAALSRLLADVRKEKLDVLRNRPLKIGVVGFGRFGQFIAKTFSNYGNIYVTSRSDYTDIAQSMGMTYVPLSDPASFLDKGLDVIVLAVSIVSFEDTIKTFVPHLKEKIAMDKAQFGTSAGPLIVDVLSVKEHPRKLMLDLLPYECDILCTHPMFGPDSGKDGWNGLNFVYERTRINQVILDPNDHHTFHQLSLAGSAIGSEDDATFLDKSGHAHNVHENNEGFAEGMDRMERFLSIWEEEGCKMVSLSCKDHDNYGANSQFITHLMGRILGQQGLEATPIDTKGFQSVLKLIGSTTADSFDLFYGLYKYNSNSLNTILRLRSAMDDVVRKLHEMDGKDE